MKRVGAPGFFLDSTFVAGDTIIIMESLVLYMEY